MYNRVRCKKTLLVDAQKKPHNESLFNAGCGDTTKIMYYYFSRTFYVCNNRTLNNTFSLRSTFAGFFPRRRRSKSARKKKTHSKIIRKKMRSPYLLCRRNFLVCGAFFPRTTFSFLSLLKHDFPFRWLCLFCGSLENKV